MPYNAPGGAASNSGVIINGGMTVAQIINAGSLAPVTQTLNGVNQTVYAQMPDMWGVRYSSAVAQNIDIGIDDDNPILSARGLCAVVSTGGFLRTFLANDYITVRVPIENFQAQPLLARSGYINFSAQSTRAGTYALVVRNAQGAGQTFGVTYSIPTANAWHRISVPISFPFLPTANPPDNSLLYEILFTVFAGANVRYANANVGAWVAGSPGYANASADNVFGDNTAGAFRVANLSITFDREQSFDFGIYGVTLAQCQRYYHHTFNIPQPPQQNVGSTVGAIQYRPAVAGISPGGVLYSFPVPMRNTPAVTFYNPNAANANWRNGSLVIDSGLAAASTGSNIVGMNSLYIENPQVVTDAVGNNLFVHASFDARI